MTRLNTVSFKTKIVPDYRAKFLLLSILTKGHIYWYITGTRFRPRPHMQHFIGLSSIWRRSGVRPAIQQPTAAAEEWSSSSITSTTNMAAYKWRISNHNSTIKKEILEWCMSIINSTIISAYDKRPTSSFYSTTGRAAHEWCKSSITQRWMRQ